MTGPILRPLVITGPSTLITFHYPVVMMLKTKLTSDDNGQACLGKLHYKCIFIKPISYHRLQLDTAYWGN